jgi:hypothetical protein
MQRFSPLCPYRKDRLAEKVGSKPSHNGSRTTTNDYRQ